MTIIPCNPANYIKGRKKKIEFIVIHYDANKGATAENNGNHFKNHTPGVSAHYFVDEKGCVQSVKDTDTAQHCGGGLQGTKGHAFFGKCTNSNSIGIELCSDYINGKYVITEQTAVNASKLVIELMKTYGINLDHVIRHFDVTGKDCPRPYVEDERKWVDFKNMLTVTDYKKILKDKVGLSDETIQYLQNYKYGDQLIEKLAKAVK